MIKLVLFVLSEFMKYRDAVKVECRLISHAFGCNYFCLYTLWKHSLHMGNPWKLSGSIRYV